MSRFTLPAGLRHRASRQVLVLATAIAAAVPLLYAPPAAAATWSLTFSDNFNGTSLDSRKWGVYDGGKGGDRVKENAIVRDGKLILRTTKVGGVWKGAGVSAAKANQQTYGKYEMRVRFDAGYGVRAVGLLWPAGGGWPPEIDFFEISARDPKRTINRLSNHYKTSGGRKVDQDHYSGDFKQWHVIGVEWTPSAIRYTMDGRTMRVMHGNIPKQKMWLGLQTRPGSGFSWVKPTEDTPRVVDMEVDWVKVYKLG